MKDNKNKETEIIEKKDKKSSSKDLSSSEYLSSLEEEISLEEVKNVEEHDLEIIETEEVPEEIEEKEFESIVELQTNYDLRTYKYINMFVIRVKRKSFLKFLILSLIILALGIYFILVDKKNYWISIVCFVVVAFNIFSFLTEEQKVDRSLANHFAKNPVFTQVFKVNDEGIKISAVFEGEEKSMVYPWAYINEINLIPEFYFLFVNGGAPLIFDLRDAAFLKGNREDLGMIIKNKILYKPFKQYDKPFFKNMNFDTVQKVEEDGNQD